MHVEVVTPRGTAVSTEADELTAPGARGEFGILPGHTPFIAALKPGVLTYKKGGKRDLLAVGAGFAEISGKDRIVLLTDQALRVDQIDVALAQKELDELDRQLKEWKPPVDGVGATREQLELERAWAQARLDARGAAAKA